jgi:hypothetical protein
VIAEVIAGIAIGSVAKVLLIAQFFCDLGIDLINRLLFGDLKEAPSGFLANPFEDFLSVGARLGRVALAAAASAGISATRKTDAGPRENRRSLRTTRRP